MRHLLFPKLLCAALVGPVIAFAAAHAKIEVSGGTDIDVSVDVHTNTAAFAYQFFNVALLPGQTVSRSFTYTVSLADDGLPATRPPDDPCTPDFRSDCGPPPSGFEQAYALIEIGRDRRSGTDQNEFVRDVNLEQSFQSVTGAPRTFTGTLTYTATDSSPYVPQLVELQVMLFALADVSTTSAVDEPAAWSLLLLGALPCLARRRGAGAALSRSAPASSAA